MPARAGTYGDDAVHPLRGGLLGVTQIDDVVKHDAAVTMNRAHHFAGRPQARDDDGNAVFDATTHVMLEPIVARVHDLIDRERRNLGVRVRARVGREFFADLRQPVVELRGRPRIERGKRSDDSGLALRRHQSRGRHDEHGRADDRQAQTIEQ